MAKTLILKHLIKKLGLSVSAFEREIGVSASVITKSIERDADISAMLIQKISSKYENINPEWLETGEGEMFIEQDLQIKEGKKKEVIPLGKHNPLRLTADQYSEAFGDWKGLPMYNAPITASFVQTYRDSDFYTPQYYLHDPRFRDCDFGAIITGDSMHSEIRHGDFIACKEVIDRRFLVFGDIYYVVATNGLETCKYVNQDPKNEDNLLLVPRNEKISPSPLPKDMILKMYKVRGIIRGY